MKAMICLILDRSGSMGGRETDVINGVNSFIEEQRKLPDPASIAFVRFDSEATERFRAMGPLAECKPLTADEYKPRGGTPLLDAVGKTIAELDADWKAEKPERCILVVVTDGQENASREYTKAKIQEMVKARQDSGMWAFVYLGANVDAFAEAGSMGFAGANTAGYVNTQKGTAKMYAATSDAVGMMRKTGATLSHNLGKNIGEDDDQLVPPVAPPNAAAPSTAWTPPTTGNAGPAPSAKVWTPPS